MGYADLMAQLMEIDALALMLDRMRASVDIMRRSVCEALDAISLENSAMGD